MKLRKGSSALMRTSKAQPSGWMADAEAMSGGVRPGTCSCSCQSTRSSPDTISVMPCSTYHSHTTLLAASERVMCGDSECLECHSRERSLEPSIAPHCYYIGHESMPAPCLMYVCLAAEADTESFTLTLAAAGPAAP